MAFVQLSDVSLAFGARDLLKGAHLYLAAGSRAALAGPNGTGKSTLMKIAAGLIKPDSGECIITRGARVSYLPQTGVVVGEDSVEGEADKAFALFADMLKRQEELGTLLADSTSDSKATARLLEEHQTITESIENSGYHRRSDRIREVLTGLGFRERDFGRCARELSGGWQMRLALARILLENPDILLLDEPTNYLDLEARSWLESFLADYPGGVLVVSHDRYFLDVTVDEVYELFQGKLSRYPGIYSQYEVRRSQELEAIFDSWGRQQEEIQKLEEFIRRFRYKASKASQVQSRVKMLEKIVPIEIPEGMKKIHFGFPAAPHSGRITVRTEGLAKSYGELEVLRDFDIEIERGMKMAFVGPNGAGKSTLMRLLSGQDTASAGMIRFGSGVQAAYFAQDSAETLDGSHTVEEEIESICPDSLLPKVRTMLGAFLFRGDDIEKPLSVLSGGERSRIALLRMLLHPANLLILDEPTNHLDLTSKDVLLEALKSFEGTVLFVSHDRGFIDELADRVLELEAGTSPRLYLGGYSYYLEKKASLEAAQEQEGAPPRRGSPVAGPAPRIGAAGTLNGSAGSLGGIAASPGGNGGFSTNPAGSSGQASSPRIFPVPEQGQAARSREEEKARKAKLKRAGRREEEIIARLAEVSREKQDAEREMALPRVYMDGAAMKRLTALVASLEAETASLDAEWESVAAEIEALGADA
jgi:ATP-binding cassette subfamily F protein 3